MPKRTFPRAQHCGAAAAMGLKGEGVQPPQRPLKAFIDAAYPGVKGKVRRALPSSAPVALRTTRTLLAYALSAPMDCGGTYQSMEGGSGRA